MESRPLTVKQNINKLWRVFATGLCFSIFGFGALFLTFIVFPILTISANNQHQREMRVQSIIQQSFTFFVEQCDFSALSITNL